MNRRLEEVVFFFFFFLPFADEIKLKFSFFEKKWLEYAFLFQSKIKVDFMAGCIITTIIIHSLIQIIL
jgi:hypothetical protein